MLAAALERHPHLRVLVKTHPEVALGCIREHFSPNQLQDSRIQLDASGGHPTALIQHAQSVYVLRSQLSFESPLLGSTLIREECCGIVTGSWLRSDQTAGDMSNPRLSQGAAALVPLGEGGERPCRESGRRL